MGNFRFSLRIFTLLILINFILTGCTIIVQKGRRVDVESISKLKGEVSNLEKAKLELENKLRKEIGDKEVTVEMLERGLVITFVAEVLFDSGKANLRESSLEKLSKVSQVLKTTVRDLSIGIDGHTDNEPIKYSAWKWKSNWELSVARALSVLHYMSDVQQIEPVRLSVSGFSQYRPVVSNDTKEGREKNRRVEIVILPKAVTDTNSGLLEGSLK